MKFRKNDPLSIFKKLSAFHLITQYSLCFRFHHRESTTLCVCRGEYMMRNRRSKKYTGDDELPESILSPEQRKMMQRHYSSNVLSTVYQNNNEHSSFISNYLQVIIKKLYRKSIKLVFVKLFLSV